MDSKLVHQHPRPKRPGFRFPLVGRGSRVIAGLALLAGAGLPATAAADGWTAWFSEEGSGRQHCRSGEAVRGWGCQGGYCDNQRLYCVGASLVGPRRSGPSISEERGRNQFVAPDGHVVVGAKCSGGYCDNLQLTYQKVKEPLIKCRWSRYFSEEQRQLVADGQLVTGVRCRGSYCDNKSLRLCTPKKGGAASPTTPPSGPQWSPWFSEEQGRVSCPSGMAATGWACRGRYCDNNRIYCEKRKLTGRVIHGRVISEERGRNTHLAPEGHVLTGAACSGRFCDNVSLEYRRTTEPFHSCAWSADLSEERGGRKLFANSVIRGVRCSGGYCDNKSFYACKLGQSTAPPASGPRWTRWFSEEQGSVSCPSGTAVSGWGCQGRYCDNSRLWCTQQTVSGPERFGAAISEERGRNEFMAPRRHVITGAVCKGGYCDNISFATRKLNDDVHSCKWSPYMSEERGGRVTFSKNSVVRGVRCKGAYCDNKSFYVCSTKAITSRPTLAPGATVALRSANYRDRYIRHRRFMGEISKIVSALDKKDSSFKIVRGLAGKGISFESVNYPGYFLRHQGFALKLHKKEGSDLYKKDASFMVKRGLSGRGYSLESINYPGYYIRHCSFQLFIDDNKGRNKKCAADDRTFRGDVSFAVETR